MCWTMGMYAGFLLWVVLWDDTWYGQVCWRLWTIFTIYTVAMCLLYLPTLTIGQISTTPWEAEAAVGQVFLNAYNLEKST